MIMSTRPRVLVVAPFTHQNGHFVTFPRDLCCGLAATGANVTLLHTRPFRAELDWFGTQVTRVCLRDQLYAAPRLWKEIWARLANQPSSLCLLWMIWKLRSRDFDLVLWTDFQAQDNVWALAIARRLGLYQFRSAFFEHHAPEATGRFARWLPTSLTPPRMRLQGLPMVVLSRALQEQWRSLLGKNADVEYLAHGLWPCPMPQERRTGARRRLGIPEDARVLLVFGVQAAHRKHLDTLRQSVIGYVPDKPLWLVFVGATLGNAPHPFADWSDPAIQVRLVNGFVPEAEVEDYFAAADAAWANYRAFPGASAVLLHAMGFGRLSLASSEGEIGALCSEHNLGLIVSAPNISALREALDAFVKLPGVEQAQWEQKVVSIAGQYAWPKVAERLLAQFGLTAFAPPRT